MHVLDLAKERFGEPTRIDSETQIIFCCPECGKKALSVNTEKGILRCFYCEYGKGIKLNGDTVTITPPKPVNYKLQAKLASDIIDACVLSDTHRQYLKLRGIYNPDKYQIKTANYAYQEIMDKYKPQELLDSGFFTKSCYRTIVPVSSLLNQRLLIPYFYLNNIVSIKTRVDPYALQPEEVKYKNSRGFRSTKYFWSKEQISKDLIITEGELKPICCREVGLDCFGVPGIGLIHNPEVKRNIAKHTKSYNRILVVMDMDPDFTYNSKLHNNLEEFVNSVPNSRIGLLPQYNNKKIDLDQFILTDDIHEFFDTEWHQHRIKI